MVALFPRWRFPIPETCPKAWIEAVRQQRHDGNQAAAPFAAQLLWQRGLRQPADLAGFLDPDSYHPTAASAFDPAMAEAVTRLQQAIAQQEKVAIWGDFDADGVTATAVLWEGLGALFPPDQLTYYIPNRLRESHGLSIEGLGQLQTWGAQLIVTCDTGSTNEAEIRQAQAMGMAVIVTDHHTLPDQTLADVPLINPRTLPLGHPLGTLSGVAVAYKLVEALYAAVGDPTLVPRCEALLDLVAIGLIADLVELTHDCRYLAQLGLRRLQTHLQPHPPGNRPGVAALLKLCKRTGDRPSDISFGLGPRINAVSRIHGDASFCVELLTSRDSARCHTLAEQAELANTRRKALQQSLLHQAQARLDQMDLATTQVVVLADSQWPAGVLGLVAGQLAAELGRPVVLLHVDAYTAHANPDPPSDKAPRLARGSARSVTGVDLYALFAAHRPLLHSFGGHPLAAGLSLPAENIDVLAAALNRSVRELRGEGATGPELTIDLEVTVAQLGKALFRELKLLEPYGMGNPVPRLLVRRAWFEDARHRNLRDRVNQSVRYLKTEFQLWDDSTNQGFAGEWWGHSQDELPADRCDVVIELDYTSRSTPGHYIARVVALQPVAAMESPPSVQSAPGGPALPTVDWGGDPPQATEPLAAETVWTQLVGMAKYMARTGTPAPRTELAHRLQIGPTTLEIGLSALAAVGFELKGTAPEQVEIAAFSPTEGGLPLPILHHFLAAVAEERFRHRYLAQRSAQFTS